MHSLTNMVHRYRWFLIGIVLFALTSQGCGWRLRGQIALPPEMQQTQLVGVAPYSDIGVILQNKLKGAGASLVGDKQQATAILKVQADKIEKRVLSIDAAGRASEYELNYQLKFMLSERSGKVLVEEQTVSTVRELRFDPDNILSTADEETRLKKDMVQFAVRQMLVRINISMAQKDKP